ncbi:hypothetical protein PUNSTDRAFT_132726 [Punctularia strigosozonata HHB-11173 SS5]|uniref:uncharacterized protein n=1 Tax=Punctularia strigosozonata (strain HHB-11173) TaxID=741275 RepID=UPI000441691A|nr:uncharacterized protein PUNSTDRAFT_132726 [Punctularia strigosozonata HHB-11173 SS5]EIN10640.1 hypothetical protein PUNSTDRAFT_132726 [Punctularia strigosozonata HHB-11173 SS5]
MPYMEDHESDELCILPPPFEPIGPSYEGPPYEESVLHKSFHWSNTSAVADLLGRIAGTVFDNQLRHNLPKTLPDGVANAVVASVTAIKSLSPEVKAVVIEAYAKSLQPVFILGVPAGILALLSAILVPNYNIMEHGGSTLHASMA